MNASKIIITDVSSIHLNNHLDRILLHLQASLPQKGHDASPGILAAPSRRNLAGRTGSPEGGGHEGLSSHKTPVCHIPAHGNDIVKK